MCQTYKDMIQDLRDKAEFLNKTDYDRNATNSFAVAMRQAANAIERLCIENDCLSEDVTDLVRELNYAVGEAVDNFAAYENAEEQGRLVILPHDMAVSMNLVVAERERQIDLWGDQSGKHPFEWMAILGEEYGELCEAVNETCFQNPKHPERGGKPNIVKEAIHVAAVAIAIAEAALKGEREDV